MAQTQQREHREDPIGSPLRLKNPSHHPGKVHSSTIVNAQTSMGAHIYMVPEHKQYRLDNNLIAHIIFANWEIENPAAVWANPEIKIMKDTLSQVGQMDQEQSSSQAPTTVPPIRTPKATGGKPPLALRAGQESPRIGAGLQLICQDALFAHPCSYRS